MTTFEVQQELSGCHSDGLSKQTHVIVKPIHSSIRMKSNKSKCIICELQRLSKEARNPLLEYI